MSTPKTFAITIVASAPAAPTVTYTISTFDAIVAADYAMSQYRRAHGDQGTLVCYFGGEQVR